MGAIKVSGLNMDLTQRDKWVAVIGSRKASADELRTAHNFSFNLARHGYIVVSGLAEGIDAAAHKGAIAGKGKTIAIVNTPIEQEIYPWKNRSLSEEIKKNGCIVHPYTTKAVESNERGLSQFSKRLIERDRLLAALCSKIVTVKNEGVIEGGTRYGMSYGKVYAQNVFRLDNEMNLQKDPEVKEGKIWWDMEIDIERIIKAHFKK
ncbi:DNA-processing protein DprA [Paenibacillus xylanexedens]|uniref:DNA-processing protein DprA n=1 Tax=Paenibacillus xylanexedens TaxID=528191 RepID=UPI0011A6114F|nr:DNA-processing protein DprA [Paenibacillus xylanexedens]